MVQRAAAVYNIIMNEQDETVIHDRSDKINRSFQLEKQGVLLILSSTGLGKTHVIEGETCLLGRGENCDFQLDDKGISKEHCLIKMEEGYFFIEDVHSSNGTFIEGKKLKKKKLLSHFDRIVMGGTILRFFLEESL
jgi:pSer/pThr/pTyr-binding forkhead associated (FHA) protein